MITTKEVKIKQADDFNSEYIETELKNMGFDVLRWAVTKIMLLKQKKTDMFK